MYIDVNIFIVALINSYPIFSNFLCIWRSNIQGNFYSDKKWIGWIGKIQIGKIQEKDTMFNFATSTCNL